MTDKTQQEQTSGRDVVKLIDEVRERQLRDIGQDPNYDNLARQVYVSDTFLRLKAAKLVN